MKKFIGSKSFYKSLLVLVVPIMIQQGLTSFLGLLDNIMVGRVGSEALSSVAIVNQLIFVFNLIIFGCVSGASIFGAQFFGNKDYEGVKHTFRFKIVLGIIACIIAISVYNIFGQNLIQLYIKKDKASVVNAALTLKLSADYLKIIVFSLPAFMLTQCYASTLRESGETRIPMYAGTIAVFTDLCLNYILIFGHLGLPALGVKGAAIATVIARYVEFFFLAILSHRNVVKYVFFDGVYKNFYIPVDIIKKIVIKGTPLILNETLYSVATAAIMQSYSQRGLDVMPAYSISSAVVGLFMVILYALGSAIAILVGQQLGSGDIEKAKDTDRKLIFSSVMLYIIIGIIVFFVANYIPRIYKPEEAVRQLATSFIKVYAVTLPMQAFITGTYFTMRAGGKTVLTFCFDSLYLGIVTYPLSLILVKFTSLNIVLVFAIVLSADVVKSTVGFILLKSGIWANNIVAVKK